MRVPKSYNDLTIGQYIELHKLSKETYLSDIDRAVKRLSIVTGKSEDYLSNMPLDQFSRLYDRLYFLNNSPAQLPIKKRLRIGFKLYKPTVELHNMFVNQLTDFYAIYGQYESDHILCLNKLLAIIYVPVYGKYSPDNHAKLSEKMLNVKVSEVIGALFFYSNLWKRVEKRMKASLAEASTLIQDHLNTILTDKEFMSFYNTGGGNTTSTYVQNQQGVVKMKYTPSGQ